MPTLFSLLNFSYDSQFYGQDILALEFKERAFMATYQDLGYYADGILTVLSPVRQVRQFAVSRTSDWHFTEDLLDGADLSDPVSSPTASQASASLLDAQAYYQAANLGL